MTSIHSVCALTSCAVIHKPPACKALKAYIASTDILYAAQQLSSRTAQFPWCSASVLLLPKTVQLALQTSAHEKGTRLVQLCRRISVSCARSTPAPLGARKAPRDGRTPAMDDDATDQSGRVVPKAAIMVHVGKGGAEATRAPSWRRWPTARKREREAADKEKKIRSSELESIDNAPPISYWTLWRCGLNRHPASDSTTCRSTYHECSHCDQHPRVCARFSCDTRSLCKRSCML